MLEQDFSLNDFAEPYIRFDQSLGPVPELTWLGLPPEVLFEAKPLCPLEVALLFKLGLNLEEKMLQYLEVLVSSFVRHLVRRCEGEVD